MSPQHKPLPDAWVRRLFERFAELYGSQKAAAMWADVGVDRLAPTWAEALGGFNAETLAAAVRALPFRDSAWPPTLPEMVALCREVQPKPAHQLALPTPKRTAEDVRAGRERLERMLAEIGRPKTGDPLAWAHRALERFERGEVPRSVRDTAVEALRNAGRLVEGRAA